MAERDEPNERSLFTRIKDCVLSELRRSKGETKRASCPSRSTWSWKPEKDGKKEPSVEDSTPEERERGESGHETNGDQVTEGDISRDRRSAAARENTGQKSEEKDTTLAAGESGSQESHGVDGQAAEENGKSHSRDVENENEEGEERKPRSAEGGGENEEGKERKPRSAEGGGENEEGKHAAGAHDLHEGDKKTRDAPPAEAEKKAEQDSCGSEKFKPVRYYIKMQNPEAPVCCASLIKPRKICPPKTRRPQRESRNCFTSRPNTCRCGGCSSDSSGHH